MKTYAIAKSTMTRLEVDCLLEQHGFLGIFDGSVGRSFAAIYGVHETYKRRDVKDWLGY